MTDIIDHTVKTWGFDQARLYLAKIESGIALLAERPRSAPRVIYNDRTYVRKRVGSHAIIARVEADHLLIVRILHERMDASRRLP